MRICPNCGEENPDDAIQCAHCKDVLLEPGMGATRSLEGRTPATPRMSIGTASFQGRSLLAYVRGYADPIPIAPEPEVIIGRKDDRAGVEPDLDLAEYGARQQGVSRQHASIARDGNHLYIRDLGSVNGTYLNGQRLRKGQARILRDGDEIHLGNLVLSVFFGD